MAGILLQVWHGWICEAPAQAERLKEKCRVVLASSSPRRQEILRLLGHRADLEKPFKSP